MEMEKEMEMEMDKEKEKEKVKVNEKEKKGIRKALQTHLSKLKRMPSNLVRFSNSGHPAASAVHRLLSASKYPSTPSMGPGRRPGATLSDIDRFLRNNFRSLYVHDDEAPPGSAPWSDATAPSSSSSSDEKSEGVTVTTVSVDPYRDFRRSMEEMMEARHADAADLDWDFMEELLLCYLDLNHERVHKHILRAFADLAISFGRSRRWRSAVTEGKEQARTSSPRGKICK